jgi:hypothetical protein
MSNKNAQRVGSLSSTKVSDGLYVVSDAYVRVYDFFETSPLFPNEVMVPISPNDDKQVTIVHVAKPAK